MQWNKMLLIIGFCFCSISSANVINSPSVQAPLSIEDKFQRALIVAISGDKDAQFLVASIYLRGYKTIKKDLKKGFEWLELAGEDSTPKRQQEIGSIYHYGDYAKRNFERAFYWYQTAANGGDADAMDLVGMFHSGGLGGADQSCGKAIAWYKKSIALGSQSSPGNLIWILATCADEKHRDGKLALSMAKEILIKSENKNAINIDNLAAAYAELNMFDLAIESQQQAIELVDPVKESSRLAKFNKRLDLYKNRKKWRGASNASPEDYGQD